MTAMFEVTCTEVSDNVGYIVQSSRHPELPTWPYLSDGERGRGDDPADKAACIQDQLQHQ